ncbi:MAG TPA: amidohydrolase [Gemmatimonadales bacterium]|nr:amidohydrolase [Gemmatimonadales bacterium]
MSRLTAASLFLIVGCASSAPAPTTTAPAPAAAPAQGTGAPAATPATAAAPSPAPFTDTISVDRPQYPSTYRRHPNPPVLIKNATILTAAGPELENSSILLQDGKIVSIGKDLSAPADAVIVDGTGKFVTPGIIDDHSHLGVYPAPGIDAVSDGNEATNPNTAQVWAEHSFWPQDAQIPLVIAGGVTVIQALPGSANLIGGRSAVLRLIPARSVQEMKYPGAPYGLKMACGENPKRVYQNRGPSTRMGNMAGYREAFNDGEKYRRAWDKWLKDRKGEPPARDLRLESIAEVLRGHILVQNHCYRADEMMQMIDLGKEFGFHFRSFHHAVEAYKIADVLAREDVAVSIWSDWWGFKLESLDGIPENAALVDKAGGRVIVHSDSPDGAQRLNQDAAHMMYAGIAMGIPLTRAQVVKWLTINPAWALGIDSTTGSLEVGKDADVVLWTTDPFSVYTKAEKVYNDGWLVFDRDDPKHRPQTDFNLGTATPGVGQ